MKLTKWFPGDVKPVREGVYEAEWWWRGDPDDANIYFNLYSGGSWHYGDSDLLSPVLDVDYATPIRADAGCGQTPVRWRGLASDPKKGKK